MNFKWDLSWIGLLGKTRRDKKLPIPKYKTFSGGMNADSELNMMPEMSYSDATNEAYDGVTGNVNVVDEAGTIGSSKPVHVYGILKGSHYEWEELDEQLFLSKEKARSQCLTYIETANFQPYQKEKYGEIREGYWRAGEYQFIELKEFNLS